MPKKKDRIKAKKKPSDSVSAHVSLKIIERIDRLVELDRIHNRSQFIKEAIVRLLTEKEAELEEFLEAKKNFKD